MIISSESKELFDLNLYWKRIFSSESTLLVGLYIWIMNYDRIFNSKFTELINVNLIWSGIIKSESTELVVFNLN